MNDLLLETAEMRVEAYRRRSNAAADLASQAGAGDIAASYRRLADCWGRLATTVERAGTAEERNAAWSALVSAAAPEFAVMARPPETMEARIVQYLDWAGEAVRSAAQARSHELRDAHLAIAASWMRLAEETMRRFDSRRPEQA